MDLYHIWCDLKPGVRDLEWCEAVARYLEALKARKLLAAYRLTRRKLGLGPDEIGEFHIMIETETLAQLDAAFQSVAARDEPVESLHFGANSRVTNLKFALYRDFPDPVRKRGAEKF
jgi:hypothetical protein